jgi:nucleoside-diphosphate-sugar epimerase
MITILGSSGFIGSNIVEFLKNSNDTYYAPNKNENLFDKNLGDVIYCIGMTADFRIRPFETVESHICILNSLLKNGTFNSLTYLSSTRLYINSKSEIAKENDRINIDPNNPDDLYTLTKLTGERICLSSGKNVKIARISNVIGDIMTLSASFIFSIINEIKKTKKLNLHQSLNSSKDYILISDVVQLLLQISKVGKNEIYNIASGVNSTNQEIINILKEYFDFEVNPQVNPKEVIFPNICIKKIRADFDYNPKGIRDQLISLLNNHKNHG